MQEKRNSSDGWTIEDYEKSLALQKEIDLVNSNTTPEERAKALVESQKSKAQLLIDELKLKEEQAKKDLADAEAKKKATEEQLALDKLAIQEKMDAIALQITSETQLMLAEDVKRRKLETDYTAFFGTQIESRKAMMQDLIEKAREAQMALQSAGLPSLSASAGTSNTTANNTVFNITNNKDVDADSFLRALNNKLPTK